MADTATQDTTEDSVTKDGQSAPPSDTSSDDSNQDKGGDKGGNKDSKTFDAGKFSDEDTQGDNADNKNDNPDDNKGTQQDQDNDDQNSTDDNNADNQDDQGGDQANAQFSWDDLGKEDNAGDEDQPADIYQTTDEINSSVNGQDDKQDKGGSDDTNKPANDNKTQDQTTEDPWKKIAADMGIVADDYTDFLSKVKSSQTSVSADSTISRIDGLLQLNGESLIRAIAKDNPEYTDEDIEKIISKAKNDDHVDIEAKRIKSDLKIQKANYENYIKTQDQQKVAKRKESADKFESSLKDKLSKTETILKGRISDQDRKSLFSHITSGKFQDGVVGDVDRLIKLAWFDLNESKVMKIMEDKGISKGKQDFLANLGSSRSSAGKSSPVDMQDARKGFDPTKFVADTPVK